MNRIKLVSSICCIIVVLSSVLSLQARDLDLANSPTDQERVFAAIRCDPVLKSLGGSKTITLPNQQTWLVGVGRAAATIASKSSAQAKQKLVNCAQTVAIAKVVGLTATTHVSSQIQSRQTIRIGGSGNEQVPTIEEDMTEQIRIRFSGETSPLSELGAWEAGGFIYVAVGRRLH
jgi:hypothetical protein